MNVFPLTKDHQKILDNIFSFSYFVHHSESVFSECHDGELVEQYRRAWFDMEVINALALAEWESDGRPESWNVKWESMFKPEAAECLDHFLKIVSKF